MNRRQFIAKLATMVAAAVAVTLPAATASAPAPAVAIDVDRSGTIPQQDLKAFHGRWMQLTYNNPVIQHDPRPPIYLTYLDDL